MGARSDAATDRVTRASAPSMAAITFCGWFQINAASAGSFNPIVRFHTASGDGTSWIVGFKGANGRTPSVYSPSNTGGINAAEQALNTYVFLAATLSGTSAALHYRNVGGSMTKVTGTVAAAGTPDRITFFGRSAADGSEWLNGTESLVRLWTSVLTDSEILAESNSATAVKAGAWGNWPFAAASLADVSGNARDLTAGSTALASAADPTFGNTTALGRATETDSVSALGRTKSMALGRAVETDTVSAFGRSKIATVGRAQETDTAAAVARSKATALARATETDTTSVLARTRIAALGRAQETDSASALGRTKAVALGWSTEVDSAAAVSRSRSLALGLAQETDTALAALQRAKSITLHRALELDSVSGFVQDGDVPLGRAVETDTVPGFQRVKLLMPGRAIETDTALPLQRTKVMALGYAVERDTVSGFAGESTVDPQTLRAGQSFELSFVEVGEPVTTEIVHTGSPMEANLVEVGQPHTP